MMMMMKCDIVVVDHSSFGACQSGLWQICSSPLNCTSVEYKSKCIHCIIVFFVFLFLCLFSLAGVAG